MVSRAWRDDDREFLKSVAGRRDWIAAASERFPDRTEASIRCMMQKVRAELGMTGDHSPGNTWMFDAVRGSRDLLVAQLSAGVFP